MATPTFTQLLEKVYALVRNRRCPNDFGFYPPSRKTLGGETKIDVSVGRVQRIQLVVPDAGGGLKRFLCVCVSAGLFWFFFSRPSGNNNYSSRNFVRTSKDLRQ